MNESRTSRSTANHDTSDAFVHPGEPTRSPESLRRLKPRFDGIDWEKKQVNGGSCYASSLSGIQLVYEHSTKITYD
jgi:hypothetical protein